MGAMQFYLLRGDSRVWPRAEHWLQ